VGLTKITGFAISIYFTFCASDFLSHKNNFILLCRNVNGTDNDEGLSCFLLKLLNMVKSCLKKTQGNFH